MPTLLTLTQPVTGCVVSAQGAPDMTVAVTAGTVLIASKLEVVAASNVTITAADATRDRKDAIVADSTGALSAIVGPLADSANAQAPDTTGYALLAYVNVASQAASTYTGTITSVAIDTSVLEYVALPEPGHSMAFTFLSGAQAAVDPGVGNFGFDTALNSTIAKLYISYTSATASTIRYWLTGVNTGSVPPFRYVRFWSRQDPGSWWIGKLGAFTNHTTWGEIEVTFVAMSTSTTGPSGAISTDALDTLAVIEETLGLVNGSTTLGADVTLTPVNTMVDVLNTGSLPVGTYLVAATAAFAGTATHIGTLRLWDGTTTYAEAEVGIAASAGSVSLDAIVVLNAAATLKISAASDTGTTDKVKAAVTKNSAGNFATILTWVRIA